MSQCMGFCKATHPSATTSPKDQDAEGIFCAQASPSWSCDQTSAQSVKPKIY